jgi:1-acyl-sn-glycerol-3-phosphate acyltransferase
VCGTREVLPVGSVHIRGGRVDFVIGEPIPTAHWTLKEREELTGLMRERVAELLERTPARVAQAVS